MVLSIIPLLMSINDHKTLKKPLIYPLNKHISIVLDLMDIDLKKGKWPLGTKIHFFLHENATTFQANLQKLGFIKNWSWFWRMRQNQLGVVVRMDLIMLMIIFNIYIFLMNVMDLIKSIFVYLLWYIIFLLKSKVFSFVQTFRLS